MKKLLLIIYVATCCILPHGCRHSTSLSDRLAHIEEMAETQPDSALAALQPAIDYYVTAKHGTPAECLNIFYCQGKILLSAKRMPEAAECIARGLSLIETGAPTDTLVWCNLLEMQGKIFYQLYDYNRYIDNFLRAAELCGDAGMADRQFRNLINAYGVACIPPVPVERADSIRQLCVALADTIGWRRKLIDRDDFTYNHYHGTPADTRKAIERFVAHGNMADDDYYFLALAYNDIGDTDKGLALLQQALDSDSTQANTLKHLSAQAFLLKNAGRYKEAFETMSRFNQEFIAHNERKFSDERKRIEQLHALNVDNLRQQQRTRMAWVISASAALLLVALVLVVYLRLRAKSLQLEARGLQLLRLEEERDELKRMVDTLAKTDIDASTRKVINERLELLNTFIAAEIGDETSFADKGARMLKDLTRDKDKFMDSLRIAYTASHPAFIRHLEERGLSQWEINYCCLYLLGLRGKEIGSYLKMRSHYNISSEIRRKLGLDESGTNLGIYLRKLLNRAES